MFNKSFQKEIAIEYLKCKNSTVLYVLRIISYIYISIPTYWNSVQPSFSVANEIFMNETKISMNENDVSERKWC